MRLEVGDWVKLRGLSRIRVVEAVTEFRGEQYIKIGEYRGEPVSVPAKRVEAVAPKFWLRKP